ncbi:hypothetical protein K7X08_021367 [Anisodus acutangulus]|uniref:Uncharacterized protein n=1 Tax=Anisodus acutangulus TaxID=402998 RepID=A0A9Q1LZQ8_9SOLA|nr:hypothetical protein K7X08_021367 [Anisodus acutangulus]
METQIHQFVAGLPSDPAVEGNAQKKRKIDVASPSFGRFPDSTSETHDSTAAPESIGPQTSGPRTLRHIFTQVHSMETQIHQFVAGLLSGPAGEGFSTRPSGTSSSIASNAPTLMSVMKKQQNIKEKQGNIERGQKKQREYEKDQLPEKDDEHIVTVLWNT